MCSRAALWFLFLCLVLFFCNGWIRFADPSPSVPLTQSRRFRTRSRWVAYRAEPNLYFKPFSLRDLTENVAVLNATRGRWNIRSTRCQTCTEAVFALLETPTRSVTAVMFPHGGISSVSSLLSATCPAGSASHSVLPKKKLFLIFFFGGGGGFTVYK